MDSMDRVESLMLDQDFRGEAKWLVPELMLIAQRNYTTGNGVNQAVGFDREIALRVLLQKYLGIHRTEGTPATMAGADFLVDDNRVEIKTGTRGAIPKVKWGGDKAAGQRAIEKYWPESSLLYLSIWWGEDKGGLYYMSRQNQTYLCDKFHMWKKPITNQPAGGSNSRGVAFTRAYFSELLGSSTTICIPIEWPDEARKFEYPSGENRWGEIINGLTGRAQKY